MSIKSEIAKACTKKRPDYLGLQSLDSRYPRPDWMTKGFAHGVPSSDGGPARCLTQGWILGRESRRYGAEAAYAERLTAPIGAQDTRYSAPLPQSPTDHRRPKVAG